MCIEVCIEVCIGVGFISRGHAYESIYVAIYAKYTNNDRNGNWIGTAEVPFSLTILARPSFFRRRVWARSSPWYSDSGAYGRWG